MRSVAVAGAALLAACAAAAPEDASQSIEARYLSDATYRRASLVASLVEPTNGYSRLRLASYESGTEDDWSRTSEWNPQVEVVAALELDAHRGVVASAPLAASAHALDLTLAAQHGDEGELVRLGGEAFFRYPVQLAEHAELAASSRSTFERYGFWTDEERGAGGLVRVEVADGSRALAYTCATCHASPRGGALLVGPGNDRLDLGRLAFDVAARAEPPSDATRRWLAWGPGRIDVTTTEAREPVRIPDLRPTRFLSHLHADGSVAQHDLTSLAIRIETLIITSHGGSVRPPRVVALALASYLWSLADTLPPAGALSPAATRGASVFRATCAGCHAPPAMTGPPVTLAVAGTDPAIGLSTERGTGRYRVPSLRGVTTRGALFHDASLPDVAAVLDPARVRASFAGGRRGPGAVPGHLFGLSLDDAARDDLVAYLQTL